jgi:hypothetical protein
MKAIAELGAVEEKVYQSYSKDGALITATGLMLAGTGACVAEWRSLADSLSFLSFLEYHSRILAVLTVISLLCILIMWLWRRFITFPRLGYSKFIATRNMPKKWRYRLMGYILAFDLLFDLSIRLSMKIAAAPAKVPYDEAVFFGFIGILLGTSLAIPVVAYGLKKLWIVIAVATALVWLAPFIHVNIGWLVSIVGILLAGGGLYQLNDFLKANPSAGATDAS